MNYSRERNGEVTVVLKSAATFKSRGGCLGLNSHMQVQVAKPFKRSILSVISMARSPPLPLHSMQVPLPDIYGDIMET
jgi:hypothetical protein